ncbi:MAG TPA: hypothetical protein VFD43_01485, partial [Planctomycetota bacterium]|nr:hypothetical protein [Planctomycetota bacterium]
MHAASCAPRGRPSPALSRPGRRSAALAVALARGAVAVALVVAAPAASRAAQLEPSPGERAQVVEVPAGAWSGDEVPAGWSLLETRSFQLQSRLDRERTAALGRHLDSLLELYRGLLPASARSDRLVVKVLADEDEYRAYGKPASRFGRYDEESGEVVVWNTRLVLGQPELTAAIRLDPDRVTTLTFAENQAVLHLADRATLAYTPDLGGVLGRLCWRQYLDQWVWPRDPPALPAWLEQGLAEH